MHAFFIGAAKNSPCHIYQFTLRKKFIRANEFVFFFQRPCFLNSKLCTVRLTIGLFVVIWVVWLE